MPTLSPWMLRSWMLTYWWRLPRTLRQFATFVWGLWRLAGELIHLVDVVTAYPYPARNARM